MRIEREGLFLGDFKELKVIELLFRLIVMMYASGKAINNAMLVRMQKPGSTYVASADEWRRKYNRSPKTGARPLVILRTFGPVSYVYELGDTEGDDFPEDIAKPFKANGDGRMILYYLQDSLKKEGIGYYEIDYGSSFAGFIKRVQEKKPFEFPSKTKKGTVKYVPHEYDIVVNHTFSDAEKCATIFHELGHYFLGHMTYSQKNKNVPKRGNEINSLLVREFEAETVCWLLCERCGINNPSVRYLNGYLDNNNDIPDGISIDTILKACGKIERMLSMAYPIRVNKN